MTETAPAFRLRAVTENDAKTLFDWRNDPVTREMSVGPAPADFDHHQAWLARTLKDPRRRLLIVELDGENVAMLRFDVAADGVAAEISVNVAPAARGRGLAAAILDAGVRDLAQARPSIRAVLARIKPSNAASVKAFTRAGFAPCGVEDGLDLFRRDLEV